jgi:hypothetical protein
MIKNFSKTTVCVWVLSVLALGWVLFGYVLGPIVIANAYRQQSLGFLNGLIAGRANHALGEYLLDWRHVANRASLDLGVLGVFAFLFLLAWNPVDRVAEGEPAAKSGISKPRLLLVYALGAIIFGGTLSDMLSDTEHWPFSPYPMYSTMDVSETYSFLRLYGVLQRSPLVEVPLDDNIYLQPFDNSRLPPALERAAMENRLDEAMADCLARYESARQAGRHGGPRLVGVRLYRLTWTLQPSASNVDQPDRKELLGDVPNHGEGGT